MHNIDIILTHIIVYNIYSIDFYIPKSNIKY